MIYHFITSLTQGREEGEKVERQKITSVHRKIFQSILTSYFSWENHSTLKEEVKRE